MKTVRQKMIVFMAALIVFMSATFFVFSRVYLENQFRQYARQATNETALSLARTFSVYYFYNNGWSGVGAFVRQMNLANVQGLTLYNQNGKAILIVGASADPDGRKHAPHPSATESDLQPVMNGNQQVGSVQLQLHDSSGLYMVEQRVQRSMTSASIWASLITAVVALAAGIWFSRRLTTPLQRMIRAIRSITAGKLETKMEIDSHDEFGEVAQSFNEMSTQLARTETSRSHLVADVSHELRIPLTIMKGQLELIQQGVKEAGPESLLPIHDEVVRLTRLVQDLHQLSLAEVGKLPLHKAPTNLRQLVGRIVHNFEVEVEERNLTLSLSSDLPDGLLVPVDKDRITQVFVNLLGNAVRYVPDGGTIQISLRQDGDDVLCTLKDTGPGIAPDHLEHIFDRFYRADEDRSRETGGTGLGLAIAKEFIESHQGRIEVNSIVGQGTTFSVWLPISA